MPADRSSILTEALKVKSSEIHWHFIVDYFDGPISGLAHFHGKLYRFSCFREDIPDQHLYVLHELTGEELKEELSIKTKFETLVGTHCSFDPEGRPLPHVLRSQESQKQFYPEEKHSRTAMPWDRPVVAWFDVLDYQVTMR